MSRQIFRHPGAWFLTGFIKITQIVIVFSFAAVERLHELKNRQVPQPEDSHV